MAFRVELSDRAPADIAAIDDWLLSHQAGNAGERWFVALREQWLQLCQPAARYR
jgi:plasmid stabilization system protein ParE